MGVVVSTAIFGAGWGIGAVCFGLGLDALGMALGFSIMAGIYTALGALIPLVVSKPELLLTRGGLILIAGNVVMIVGVIICGVAGGHRDRIQQAAAANTGPTRLNPKVPFALGLALCVAAGILCAMLNFAFAFGAPITEQAMARGATATSAINAIWMVALPAGGLMNVAYCLYLLGKRKSWGLLIGGAQPLDLVKGLLMAVLWTGSIFIYGWGAHAMGPMGASLGWAIFNATVIPTTLIGGLLMHEWKGVHGKPMRLLFTGILVLVTSVLILGMGGTAG